MKDFFPASFKYSCGGDPLYIIREILVEEKTGFKDRLQILRAIAIFLVILHHSVNKLPDVFVTKYLLVITYADVIIFFMISGFLFEKNFNRYKENIPGFIKKKIRQLILPYLFWTLSLYIAVKFVHDCISGKLSDVLNGLEFVRLSWGEIVRNTLTFQDYYVEFMWFIYVLFFLFVVNIFVGEKLNHFWILFVIMLLGTTVSYYCPFPMIVYRFIRNYGDFLMGRLLFRNLKKMECKRIYYAAGMITVICFIILSVCWQDGTDHLVDRLGFEFSRHLMCWSFCILCFKFTGSLQRIRMGGLLKKIGDYSYDIYLMHIPYVVPVVAVISYGLTNQWLISLVVTVVSGIVIPSLISKFFIRKIPILRTIALGR